jgi:murein DD-endopeptidase MepM/ murein hydrolase activator NlpD
VLTPFRAPTHAYGPGHRGVDLAGHVRQPVLAALAGTVVFAGPVAGHGVVSVQHDDGLRTTYEPVSPTVAAGALVRTGDVLGLLAAGHSGCPGSCLHWGVRRDRLDYLDPLVLLGPTRVRLLPVPDPFPDGDAPTAGPMQRLSRQRVPRAGRAAARRAGSAAGRPATR